MPSLRFALLAATAFAVSTPALAQQTSAPAPEPGTEDGDDFHGTIYVTAGGLQRLDMLAGTSVMEGDELQRSLDGQIGEVLAKVSGVSATSFSPGASRPVLRGLQGDRVRVLVDGIGSIDAANVSTDHAVPIDPLTAERIEVLRGPAGLLYGSSAIGGVVNVIDKRIPRRVPEERVHIERFGVPQQPAVGAVMHEAQPGDAQQAKVTIVRDGLQREITFTKDQPSILDCASAAGLEVPYSCTSGVCGTCRAKLVEGQVRMERNFALDKNEVAAGFVLTCQAHPTTERVVLSFDER